MTFVLSLNLIRFLDFYFAFMLFAGLFRRLRQYQAIGRLVFSGPSRWPNLLQLVSKYRMLFFNLPMLIPAGIAAAILFAQLLASRFLFPEAGHEGNELTVLDVVAHWLSLVIVLPLGAAMLCFDVYTLYLVGNIDRELAEKYFDQAEFWLRSRTAHVVRVVTFGWINPRRMVAEEVEKALREVGGLLNYTLWWVILQMGLRLSFGLSLWITWAFTHF